MILRACNINILRKQLSAKYWSGHRWMVGNALEPVIKPQDQAFFCSYIDAVDYCVSINSPNQPFRIKVIADMLKVLNGKMISSSTRSIIQNLVTNYPIRPFHHDGFISGMSMQNYYPALWDKPINPLTAIEKYHIIELSSKKLSADIQKNEVKVLQIHNVFKDVLIRYQNLVQKSIPDRNMLLVGQFLNHRLVLDSDGNPLYNSGLLLFSTNCIDSVKAKEISSGLQQINDICSPVIISWPVILRYNQNKSRLDFFDDKLKRIVPGTLNKYLNFHYFDLTQSLQFVP